MRKTITVILCIAFAGSILYADANRNLFYAIYKKNSLGVKKALRAGANANAVYKGNNKGWTALISASFLGEEEIARILIKAGANINAKTRHTEETPLMIAAFWGGNKKRSAKVVKLLIAAGADLNAKNHIGRTALILALLRGRAETARLLTQAGADVNAEDMKGYTALIFASFWGRTEIVKFLYRKRCQS